MDIPPLANTSALAAAASSGTKQPPSAAKKKKPKPKKTSEQDDEIISITSSKLESDSDESGGNLSDNTETKDEGNSGSSSDDTHDDECYLCGEGGGELLVGACVSHILLKLFWAPFSYRYRVRGRDISGLFVLIIIWFILSHILVPYLQKTSRTDLL